jgi:PAS domain-containing protein
MFVDLLHNAVYLLALGVIYDVLELRSIKDKQTREALTGLLIGCIGIVVMITAWEVAPGVLIDTRWVLLGLCGLFFGLIPTIIALIVTSVFRLYLGGESANLGVLVLLVAAMLGLGWRYLVKHSHLSLRWNRLLAFGVTASLLMLFFVRFLKGDLAQMVLPEIALPVLAIYPVATLLLGLILRRQRDKSLADKALQASENRFRSLFESSEVAIWNMGFSKVYEKLEQLRESGVADLRKTIQQDAKLLAELVSGTTVIQVNDALLRLFGAASKKEFLQYRDKLLTSDIVKAFVDSYCAIWNGDNRSLQTP